MEARPTSVAVPSGYAANLGVLSVFGGPGSRYSATICDIAPVDELAELRALTGALLVLDEAHLLGPHLPEGIDGLEAIRVGTLSKALGSLGGWMAGAAALVDLVVNRARSFIFTTALTPADTAAGPAPSLP